MTKSIASLNEKILIPGDVITLSDGRRFGIIEWHPHVVLGCPVKVTAELVALERKQDPRKVLENLLDKKYGAHR